MYECKYIKHYVNNREEILNELSTHYNTNRDAIKNLFIALLNSGSFKMWALDNNINDDEHKFIKKIKK